MNIFLLFFTEMKDCFVRSRCFPIWIVTLLSQPNRSIFSSILAKRPQLLQNELSTKLMYSKARTAISNRSKALFTLSAICTATSELLNGSSLSTQNKIDLAKEYWSAVGRNISEWNMVKSGEMKSSAVRKDYICSLSITLVALRKCIDSKLPWNLGKSSWEAIYYRLEKNKSCVG